MAASPTVGKVFFSRGGADYVCSGATVTAKYRNLVLTAGHCLYDEDGWATRWAFAPYYSDGKAPYGLWTAKRMFTTKAWRDRLDFQNDIGFVVMNPRRGKSIGQVVGYNGILFHAGDRRAVTVLGYPAARPYDGRHQRGCQGTTRRFRFGGRAYYALAVDCDLTAGSSGGPWLDGYGRRGRRWGYAYGVVSLGAARGGGWVATPFFGYAAERFYRSVAASR